MHLSEEKINSEEIYKGRIITLTKDTVKLENGKEATREVIHHPGAVCVIPIDEDGNVIFVKQFRYPFSSVLLEIPAGKLEEGEDSLDGGKRELLEETGALCESFEYLGEMYPSVAYLTEKIYIYLARGLTFKEQSLDEDEFVEVEKIPYEKAVKMVMNDEIKDAKTQIAVLKAAFYLKK